LFGEEHTGPTKGDNMQYHTLSEASRKTGIAHHRIRYAYQQGYLPPPRRFNNSRLLTDEDVERISAYFTRRQAAGLPAKTREDVE
jgi:DNA-binding transcriptional MerR regulator